MFKIEEPVRESIIVPFTRTCATAKQSAIIADVCRSYLAWPAQNRRHNLRSRLNMKCVSDQEGWCGHSKWASAWKWMCRKISADANLEKNIVYFMTFRLIFSFQGNFAYKDVCRIDQYRLRLHLSRRLRSSFCWQNILYGTLINVRVSWPPAKVQHHNG